MLVALVIIIKALAQKGTLLKGGIISGHSAAGFFFAATILFVTKNAFTAILGLIMALLIAQSRVQAKIHTLKEVITGAVVATLLTGMVYWLWPGCTDWLIPWLQKVTHTGMMSMMSLGIPGSIAIICVLLLCTAFFAIAEIALVSVRRTRIRQFVEEGVASCQDSSEIARKIRRVSGNDPR